LEELEKTREWIDRLKSDEEFHTGEYEHIPV